MKRCMIFALAAVCLVLPLSYAAALTGDVNNNQKVEMDDAILALQAAANIRVIADADLGDAVSALQILAGIQIVEGRAVLGPLSGADVNVFRLRDFETPVYSTRTQTDGRFTLVLSGIASGEPVLVAVTGGTDTDANDDGTPGPSVANAGTIYALLFPGTGGEFNVTALSDIAWRYTENMAGDVNDDGLKIRMNDLAMILFQENTDLNGDQQLDHKDVLSFNPLDSTHRNALGFDFQNFFSAGESGKSLMDCHHENLKEILPAVLEELFGTRMTRFPAADTRNAAAKVSLTPFGKGSVTDSTGKINFDSGRTADQNTLYGFYTRDENVNAVLTAVPAQDSKILGWEGCDSVSDDLTRCECSLGMDREIIVTFGYREVQTKGHFADLGRALVERNNDELHVYAAYNDTEMAAKLAQLSEGSFVVGYAGGGFLLKVLHVNRINDYEYILTTSEDASLEDIIAQGTGTLTRKMTHGDLAAEMNSGARSARGTEGFEGIEGVRMLSSDNPDDDVFSIQIGNPESGRTERSDTSQNWDDDVSFVLNDGNSEVEVRIRGQLDLEVFVNTAVSFSVKGLEEFRLVPEIRSKEKLEVTVSGELNKEWEKKLGEMSFGKIGFSIGLVPVWVSFQLKISVCGEAKISVAVTSGVEAEAAIQAGFSYHRENGISPVTGFSNSWKFIKPDIQNDMTLRAFLKPELGVLLYSVTGPYISFEPGLELRAKLLGADEVENNCRGGVDISAFFSLESNWEWSFSEDTKIGKLLHLESIENSEPLFKKEWPIDRWNYPGTQCGLKPARLDVTGENIFGAISYGTGNTLTKQFVLKNTGNFALDWKIEHPADGILSLSQTQGTLGELQSATVTMSVDTSKLGMGVYLKTLKFKNASGSVWSRLSDFLSGNTSRIVSIIVMPPAISAPVLGTPVSVSPTNVRLSWQYPDPGTLKYVKGYYVFQSTDNETWEILPDGIITDPSQTSFVVDNLFPNTTYYFGVAAYDRNSFQSNPSNTVQFSVAPIAGGEIPAPPAGISALAGDGRISLSWNAADGAVYYNLYMASASGPGKSSYATLPGGMKYAEVLSPYAVTGLTNGTAYYFRLTSVNTFGESAESAEISAVPFKAAAVPFPPGSLLAVPGDGQATLSWPSVQGASLYNIYMATASGVSKSSYLSLPGGRKISDAKSPCAVYPLSNNVTYYFRITAENVLGESMDSGEVSATPKIYTPPAGDITNSLGMTFRRIPAGTFMMGSPSTEPGRDSDEIQHQVTLTSDFYMQTTEVTQKQWRDVMGTSPSYFSACGDNCPVEYVSWNDVQTFITAMNARGEGTYRLPTEAEWEYAARGGSTTAFYNGAITYTGSTPLDPNLDAIGWYYGNSAVSYTPNYSGKGTHPVAQKQPNAYGLYDMSGNVWEWCQDWYGTYPTTAVTNPVGPSTGSARVLRGGSWLNYARLCRSAYRYDNTPSGRDIHLGFRLLLSPQVSR